MRALDWLADRFATRPLVAAARCALARPAPAGVGWGHTLGALALALVVCQLGSGALLLLYYQPTPEAAHASVTGIMEQVPGGWLVRSLHVWGATLVVVAVLLHALRVFATRGYRAPREGLWLVGLAIAATVLALAFTGSLLPWTQHGYWGTTIATEMAASAPLGGESLRRLVRGADTISAPTLGRFFAAHAFVLPALLLGLLALHARLLRHHGIAPRATDDGGAAATIPPPPGRPWRDHALRAAAVAVAGVGLLWLLAIARPALLEEQATPLVTKEGVRPEWYFLPLYQLQKYFGPTSLLGIDGGTRDFVLTNGLLLLPVLVPFVDTDPSRRSRRRRLVVGLGALWLGAMVVLGAAGAVANREVDLLGARCAFDDLGRPTTASAPEPADGGEGEEPSPPPRTFAEPDEKCAACHQGEWRSFSRSVHFAEEVVSCSICHGGDGSTMDQALAHAEDDFVEAPVEDCTLCHELESEKLDEGPHGEAVTAGAMRGCIDCHGPHAVLRPTHGMLVDTCERCHRDEPEVLARAKAARDALAGLDQALPEAGSTLMAARDATATRLLSQLAELKQVREKAARLPSGQHDMDLEALTEAAGRHAKTARALADDGAERLARARRRPLWGLLVVIVSGLNIALLLGLRWLLGTDAGTSDGPA